MYPVSVSDYAPKKVRERAASEGQPAAGAADRSSETHKTPRQQPTEARPADGTDNDHEAPLAPAGPHERPANGPDDGDDNPPIPFKPRGAREEAPARANSAEGDFDDHLDRLEFEPEIEFGANAPNWKTKLRCGRRARAPTVATSPFPGWRARAPKVATSRFHG